MHNMQMYRLCYSWPRSSSISTLSNYKGSISHTYVVFPLPVGPIMAFSPTFISPLKYQKLKHWHVYTVTYLNMLGFVHVFGNSMNHNTLAQCPSTNWRRVQLDTSAVHSATQKQWEPKSCEVYCSFFLPLQVPPTYYSYINCGKIPAKAQC